MAANDPRVDRALVPLLLSLTDVADGNDTDQREAGLISKVCRLLQFDLLYTVHSDGTCWVKEGFGVEGAMGRFTLTRPTGIIRHVLAKKTRMLQKQLTGRGAFHRCQDGWPGWEPASFLAVPLRRKGSIDGVLVLLRGPDLPPFDLEEFDRAEWIAEALTVRRATGRTIKRLTQLSRTDEATGLPNDRAARQALEREIERARRLGEGFSIARIAFAGVDRLPRTREARGGDATLARLAELVAGSVRGSDFLARLSTNELFLVLPDTSRDGMTRLVSRIEHAIRTEADAELRRLRITASFSGAFYPDDGLDARSLFSDLRAIEPEAVGPAAADPAASESDDGKEKKAAA